MQPFSCMKAYSVADSAERQSEAVSKKNARYAHVQPVTKNKCQRDPDQPYSEDRTEHDEFRIAECYEDRVKRVDTNRGNSDRKQYPKQICALAITKVRRKE